MRVVLDTNVIVSSYLVALGPPARIVAAWRAGRFELVVSTALLAEYARALMYDRVQRRHHLSVEQIYADVAQFRVYAHLVEPVDVPAVIPADRDDDHVLACAIGGNADYIVSGDPHLVDLTEYQGIRIVRPSAFLAVLGETA
jgi:putative PIN family toxin of toxin-antitoxin system